MNDHDLGMRKLQGGILLYVISLADSACEDHVTQIK